MNEPVLMDRFRINIIIGGCDEPHFEDKLGEFRIGNDIILRTVKLISRCKVTQINQQNS